MLAKMSGDGLNAPAVIGAWDSAHVRRRAGQAADTARFELESVLAFGVTGLP